MNISAHWDVNKTDQLTLKLFLTRVCWSVFLYL